MQEVSGPGAGAESGAEAAGTVAPADEPGASDAESGAAPEEPGCEGEAGQEKAR
jgi:hypothetical protein